MPSRSKSESKQADDRSKRGRDDAASGRSHAAPAEWVVAAVSTVIVLAMLGYTIYEGVTRDHSPPLISVRADSVVASNNGYVVVFTARNEGGSTAAAVLVRGTVRRDTTTLEESEATIDYVPIRSSAVGALIFTIDPRRYRLELRAIGFDTP